MTAAYKKATRRRCFGVRSDAPAPALHDKAREKRIKMLSGMLIEHQRHLIEKGIIQDRCGWLAAQESTTSKKEY